MKLQTTILTALTLLLSAPALYAATQWHQSQMWSAPGYSYGITQFLPNAGNHIHIQQRAYPDSYRILISVSGRASDSVNISAQPGMLTIDNSSSNEEHHQSQGGGGFFHSWSSMSQSIALPGDANTGGMTRQNGNGTIMLVIPRHPVRRW
ncbi:MAG: Hsp20/alpha crystallin family protein [Sedimenticola sp.]